MLNCKQICNLGALSRIVKPLKKYSAYSTEFLRLRGRFCLRCRKIMFENFDIVGKDAAWNPIPLWLCIADQNG